MPKPNGDDHEHYDSVTRPPTGYVTERAYFERILHERRRSHDSEHLGHDEQHATEQQAMEFARNTLEAAVNEARVSVSARHSELVRRLETLESGGAPFASRLDDSLNTLKKDVDILKEGAVTSRALEGVRQDANKQIADQKRQIKYIFIAAGVSFMFSLILVGIRVLG